jgi:hypothetical protein|tara:strand:- start:3979 stop:4308 length:330 start_codon:yes stop_codon:yes gene_type:complete
LANDAPFAAVSGGVNVRVRLTPKAARDAIGGTAKDARGITALKATVTAPPEGGKANKTLIGMLAKSWRLAKTSISVKSGLTHRQKTLLVEGDTEMLMKKLMSWMEGISG